jgi:hypothetical protein
MPWFLVEGLPTMLRGVEISEQWDGHAYKLKRNSSCWPVMCRCALPGKRCQRVRFSAPKPCGSITTLLRSTGHWKSRRSAAIFQELFDAVSRNRNIALWVYLLWSGCSTKCATYDIPPRPAWSNEFPSRLPYSSSVRRNSSRAVRYRTGEITEASSWQYPSIPMKTFGAWAPW